MVRALIDWQVNDLLDHTRQRLQEKRIRSVEHVRRCPQVLVGPGSELMALKAQLEEFLTRRVYCHYRVMRMATKARRFVTEIFHEYCRVPDQLPTKQAELARTQGVEQTVCDYLAGMTDRFAQDEYLRLFHPYESV
jgi:dGTPase